MDIVKSRVGSIVDVSDKVVRFLGFGTYKGVETLSSDDADVCGQLSEFGDIAVNKIELDSGKILYECEAHIFDEVTVTQKLLEYLKSGYDIINVDIDDVREEN